LPALVLSLALNFRLAGRVDALEQALGGAATQALTDAADGGAERSGRSGRGRRGVSVSFEERQDVLRTRLEAFITEGQLDDDTTASLRELVEALLVKASDLHVAKTAGELDSKESRQQLDDERDVLTQQATELMGEEQAQVLYAALFGKPDIDE
jgi:hypothetical protein